jgi:hypothetical protein
MVTGLSKPLNHNEPFEFELENKTVEVEVDLQKKLEMNSKISKSRTTKDVTIIVKKG